LAPDVNAQDGWDLWLKIANRYRVANVGTPLFYYRQHGESLSRDTGRLLENRRRIKRNLVSRDGGKVRPGTAAVVPVKNTYADNPDIALRPIAGRPLIDYTIEDALEAEMFGTVFVSTDDPRVAEHCARTFPSVRVNIRPEALSHSDVSFTRVVHDTVTEIESKYDVFADILAVLSVHTPLRRKEHIVEAVDTLLLHDCDSVISVVENADVHYRHGVNGLEPLNPAMAQSIRLERESLYIDNRSIRALWRDTLKSDDLLGVRIGHIVMDPVESLRTSSEDNIWLIERHLRARRSRGRVS
jgi:CMP-N-acetylneuraminic acid synthetase